jgi:hypothetical protein
MCLKLGVGADDEACADAAMAPAPVRNRMLAVSFIGAPVLFNTASTP